MEPDGMDLLPDVPGNAGHVTTIVSGTSNSWIPLNPQVDFHHADVIYSWYYMVYM